MSKRKAPEFRVIVRQSPDADKTFEEILHSKEMKRIVRKMILGKKELKSDYKKMKNENVYLTAEKMEKMFKFWGVKHGEHKRLLSFLISTKDELTEFMERFYNGNTILNMIKYQKHKRETNKMKQASFLRLYHDNQIEAIQSLFQEPLTDADINLLKRYKVTPAQLYERLQLNPQYSFSEAVRANNHNSKTYSDDFLIRY